MPALHISPKNPDKHVEFINTLKNAPVAFILVYMEGCGPCGEVRPEWDQLYDDPFLLNNAVMADIDHTVLGIDANKDLIKDPTELKKALSDYLRRQGKTSSPRRDRQRSPIRFNRGRDHRDIRDLRESLSRPRESSKSTDNVRRDDRHRRQERSPSPRRGRYQGKRGYQGKQNYEERRWQNRR